MGFWGNLRQRAFGNKAREARTPALPVEPQVRPRMDFMDHKSFDLGQRFEQIFTAIKLGFADMKETFMQVTKERDLDIISRLDIIITEQRENRKTFDAKTDELIKSLGEANFRRAGKIKTRDVLAVFENYGKIELSELADALKANPNKLHYHLNKLIDEKKVRKIGEGLYENNELLGGSEKDKKIKKALERLSRKKRVSYNFKKTPVILKEL